MSSKRPVSRFREVVAVTKDKRREIRDPRFEEGAGQLNQDLFKKSYAFVDDMKKKEKLLIQKEVKKTKNTEKKAQLQSLLVRMVRLHTPLHVYTHIMYCMPTSMYKNMHIFLDTHTSLIIVTPLISRTTKRLWLKKKKRRRLYSRSTREERGS